MSITLGRAAIGGGIAFASVLATAPFTPSPTLGPTDARAAAPVKAQTAAQASMAPAASGNTPASAASSSSTAQSAKGAKGQGTSTKWTCPMHPHFIADEMGTCPICGMDLVKFETGSGSQAATGSEQRTIITVAPEVIQTMGVRIASAELSELGRQVRSFGTVIENQRLQTEVTARVEGWVEHLDVTAVGDQVKAGDRLFQLYSPQLVISQNDYMRSRETTELAERGISQLRAFGVQDKAIEEMRASRQPLQRVPFFADRSGTVSELMLRRGTYVKRGMLLARIQDYSKVWLIVSVAEKDLTHIAKETPAVATFPNLPGREVKAVVDYVHPIIDPKTRTGQVRLVLDNADGTIRPGSYADVVFDVGAKPRIAVPSEAILKNGDGRFIVVSLGQGRFEPRRVQTGLVSGRWTQVNEGVQAGENVVVSGQFLLDSESALREAFGKLQRLATPLSLLKLDSSQMAMVDHMVDAALYLHEALTDGYAVDPKQLDAAISIREFLWPRFKATKLAFVLDDAVAALRQAQAAKADSEVRAALAALGAALRPWLLTGAPDHYREKKVAFFKEANGARVWLQMAGRTSNPYGTGDGTPIELPVTVQPQGETAQTTAAPPAPQEQAPAAPGGTHVHR